MSALAFEAFLSTPEVAAVFDAPAIVQAMLDFEAALVRAQAAEGLVPAAAAQAIAGVCKAELFDVPGIVAAGGRAGSMAIPLVKRLTETVALFDAEAAGFVHWGCSSQDVIDTGLVLLTRRALAPIDRDLTALITALLHLAQDHETAPLLRRTLLQPAQVVSWGFKLLAWIVPLLRSQQAVREVGARALQLQLGGAVGMRVMLGAKGDAIAARMADSLQLRLPAGAWHTQRDEAMRLHAEIGILCGTLGKVAKDITLMAQAELGEVAEPDAAGPEGASAMAHKRGPVASMVALSGALRAPQRVAALLAGMVQDHERGLGNWQTEPAETAALYLCAHGALAALAEAAAGLQVDPARMLRNIDALQGLVFAEAAAMALATHIGSARADALLEQLSREAVSSGRPLAEMLRTHLLSDGTLRARLGPDFAPARLDTTLGGLFNPGRAAEPAITLARPQLAALAEQARVQCAAAPWAAWLNRTA